VSKTGCVVGDFLAPSLVHSQIVHSHEAQRVLRLLPVKPEIDEQAIWKGLKQIDHSTQSVSPNTELHFEQFIL
jgi:hypothetical protein